MLYKKPKNLLADTTQKTPKHCFFHQKTQMRPLPLQNTFRHLASVMYDKTMTQKNSWNPQIPADLIRNASSKHSVFYSGFIKNQSFLIFTDAILNLSCTAIIASSISFLGISSVILISDVEIISMFTPASYIASKNMAATPGFVAIPAPTMDSFATFSS